MPTAKQHNYLTEAEYLEGELHSEIKHEYIDGEVYAMVGVTKGHNLISGNTFRKIGNHLEGKPCQTYISDMKVKVDNSFYYPDVMVDCSEKSGGKDLFKGNPVLIVEVLSDSTKNTDRTAKFAAYQKIPTLEEYALIEQDSVNVQIHRRREDWHGQVYLAGEDVSFEAIGLVLPIEEVYSGVDLVEFGGS